MPMFNKAELAVLAGMFFYPPSKNRPRKMPVERVLAKIGKKHRVEAKMAQNGNTGLTGVYCKI